jgi:hypothetical protein
MYSETLSELLAASQVFKSWAVEKFILLFELQRLA